MRKDINKKPKPTEFELDLLCALWKRGSGTVRDLYEDLNQVRQLGYTSILKTLQIMTRKGLVHRVDAGKAHIYRASSTEAQTQTQLIDDLSKRLFAGSAAQLAMHAISKRVASATELQQIKILIEQTKEKQ